MTSSADSAGLRSRAFVALMLVYLAVAVNGTVSNIALPSIASDLDATTNDLAWIVNATPMTSAAVLLLAGGVADRFGRRRVLFVGIGFFLASALASMLVHTPGQLIALRALSGIASAFTMPAAMALVFVVVGVAARSTAIGLMSSTQAIGAFLGPLLGGLVLMSFAWPAAFLVVVPFLLVALLMLIVSLPADGHISEAGDRPPLDLPGSALMALAGLALIFAVIEGPTGRGPMWIAALVIAVIAVIGLLWWERRIETGLIDLSVVRHRRWYIPTIGVFVVNFVLGGIMFLATQYIQLVLGYPPLTAALFLLPALLVWTASAAGSGWGVRRLGHKRVILIGFVGGAAGLVIVAAAALGPSLPLLLLGLTVVGLLGAAPAQLTHLTVSSFPQRRRGAGSALNSLTLRFGLAFGVALCAAGLSLVYTDALGPDVAALIAQSRQLALGGLASALQVATQLGGQAGLALAEAARDSFVRGYQAVLVGSAGLVLLVAALTAVGLPRSIDIPPDAVLDEAA